jgi:septal ring factor EnvC (AmiA/AmiB activator)
MAPSTCLSASRRNSPGWSRGPAGVLAFIITFALCAQGREGLEKKRDALDKRIQETSNLIERAKNQQKNTAQQVQLLDARIRQRQELIATMSNEVVRVDQQIQDSRAAMRDLAASLDELKQAYARMAQFAYMNRSAYDRLSYIFAAESFSQAFKRSRYLDQLAAQRRQQAVLIAQRQDSLHALATVLEARKVDRSNLLDRQVSEARMLNSDKEGQQQTLVGLKREEGRLRAELAKQERQRKELAAAIRKAIESELAATRKSSAPATSSKSAGKLELNLTPEAKLLGADFEKNKASSLARGERRHHQPLRQTAPPGATRHHHREQRHRHHHREERHGACRSSAGEVSSVIVIPGAGKAVILSHGAYRTVYSNLREVSVAKGQKVDTKQTVGTVLTDENRFHGPRGSVEDHRGRPGEGGSRAVAIQIIAAPDRNDARRCSLHLRHNPGQGDGIHAPFPKPEHGEDSDLLADRPGRRGDPVALVRRQEDTRVDARTGPRA